MRFRGRSLADLEVVSQAKGDDGVDLEGVQVALVFRDLAGKVGLRGGIGGHVDAGRAVDRRVGLQLAGVAGEADVDEWGRR